MLNFIAERWRDFVGLAVMYTGVAVALTAPEAREILGLPLVMAGLAMLKLPTNEQKPKEQP